MLFGLDGVEIGLIIVFLCLFGGILTGFPVAFAIGGAGLLSFGIIAALDSAGILVHQAIDTGSQAYREIVNSGVNPVNISHFRYPDLPTLTQPLFPGGWESAVDRNLSFIVNRMNERVFAGASIETLLAVLMFVMMGIVLERSKIANDLLTTMARVFGPLPGGLAVSVVIVGAFLAASTGIVGATVVTMGLLSLPTMLRHGYSPQLATGVIAASGTLGQIIPPSIVIVLLGTLAGDIYSAAQEARAQAAGCTDALTYLGEPAVVSVGTLFQAAMLPGIFLAGLYALYAFGYALLNPHKAPPVHLSHTRHETITRREGILWFLAVPVLLVGGVLLSGQAGLSGSQSIVVSGFTQAGDRASLRTNVSPQCQEAMIELHGQIAWNAAVAEQEAIDAAGGSQQSVARSPEEIERLTAEAVRTAPKLSGSLLAVMLLIGLVFSFARGSAPSANPLPLLVGTAGIAAVLALDAAFVSPLASSGTALLIYLLPFAAIGYGLVDATRHLARNELFRVVFPPLVLIVAVLGSILGGVTNPTPAAGLGAGGALLLAAYRKLADHRKSGRMIVGTAFAIVLMILVGSNFDLRMGRGNVPFEDWVAYLVALGAYYVAMFGILYACWVLLRDGTLGIIVRETAKVTSMVFTILIGSQLLNLVVISFGGEHYIQQFLRSFDNEFTVFLLVMLVLFILGFVLDFLEIIYIVVPIVGPVIYGGTMDPKWVTIMIAVNLQTSFLTPPFGFALFYLRGVAPASVTTGHIYRGILPFVLIQLAGIGILWTFPEIVTIVPNLLSR
ncbi:TRAP transporter large permease [Celeribacter indicus]|uniref:TRAP C4-dicarboxylate transport system permease DctM n=1 Tax=Celeribacter indicus TaxID=1208324 RepID=A0A0B5DWC2_9RHOB|nr:TRAP transporter large permease subunit [Celeribacter indicus]AJE47663.1 TRAP C4-dicarboxylate transport system permease DctM [Celeribacter indicus]SDW13589.1 TRAP transporter, DctM subunit [Celeribacter indicus]